MTGQRWLCPPGLCPGSCSVSPPDCGLQGRPQSHILFFSPSELLKGTTVSKPRCREKGKMKSIFLRNGKGPAFPAYCCGFLSTVWMTGSASPCPLSGISSLSRAPGWCLSAPDLPPSSSSGPLITEGVPSRRPRLSSPSRAFPRLGWLHRSVVLYLWPDEVTLVQTPKLANDKVHSAKHCLPPPPAPDCCSVL